MRMHFVAVGPKVLTAPEVAKAHPGRGLIPRLAELQNPDHDKRKDAERFEVLNSLLRKVIDRADESGVTGYPRSKPQSPMKFVLSSA